MRRHLFASGSYAAPLTELPLAVLPPDTMKRVPVQIAFAFERPVSGDSAMRSPVDRWLGDGDAPPVGVSTGVVGVVVGLAGLCVAIGVAVGIGDG
jgi:hypothetical protein